MVGGSERRGQKDSLPAWIRAARREPPSLDTPLFIILSPFSSIIVPISSLFLPLFITGTWMDKQRNADQFEYRELGYPLFEIFAEARGPSLSPFLPSRLYLSLSLSFSFFLPILPGLTGGSRAPLFNEFVNTVEPVFEINPDFRWNCCRWKPTEFFVVFRVSVLIGLPLERSFAFYHPLDHLVFSTRVSRGRKFIFFFFFFRINGNKQPGRVESNALSAL